MVDDRHGREVYGCGPYARENLVRINEIQQPLTFQEV